MADRRIGRAVAAALASTMLLAGCDDPVAVSKVEIARNYLPEELLRYGSGGNALRIVVTGDPYGAGGDATADAVVAAMQGRNIGPPVAFAREPASEAQPPTRVIVVVNPPATLIGQMICQAQGPIPTVASEGGVLRISAAWCQSNHPLSSASATVEEADGFGAETFALAMEQLTIALFPPKNPHID